MSDDNQDTASPPTKKQKLDSDVSQLELYENCKEESEIDFSEDVTNVGDKEFAVNDDKYNNFVTPEELEKLREFKVLDEVKSNDEESDEEESDSSDGKSEGLPDEEIEKMLEEDLPDELKGAPKPKEKPYITRQKIVLEEKGINHFEVLPLDWMMVRHYSGMPVYMHRATRVCTLSKPYFLGKGNTRRHDIPISAIPCLAYRRALEEEQKQKEIDRKIEEQIRNGTWVNNAKSTNADAQNDENLVNSVKNVSKEILVNEQIDSASQQIDAANTSKRIDAANTSERIVVADSSEQMDVADKNIIYAADTSERMEVTDTSERISVAVTEQRGAPGTIEQVSATETSERNCAVEENEQINVAYISERIEGADTSEQMSAVKTSEGIDAANTSKRMGVDVISEPIGAVEVSEQQTSERMKCPFAHEQTSEMQNGKGNEDNEIPLNRQPVVLPGGIVMPPPRVETVNTSWKTQHLTHEQVNGYCSKLFKFKTVNIMHFKRWADRRKYTKARKALQYPTLPEGTKLITIPAQPLAGQDNGGKANKRDWVMNMNGRSYLSVFHEYVRRALQKQPVYEFKQLENASTPYQATVHIGGMQYGVGLGSSKRQAKAAAARASIHILIPEMRDELEPAGAGAAAGAEPDFTFFDHVGIEDPRITEFCAATCEPSPHAILRTCLLRNFGAGDRHIHTEMKKLEYQKIELTMKVGKHTATVVCKNKKTAKQRASQAILQALHPHVRSWGSLLRLYGSRSVKSCKERKLEEQQITLLQDKARHNQPNRAVLDKLRHEMRRLRERDAAVVPVGTLLLSGDGLPTHSGSNLNNVDL